VAFTKLRLVIERDGGCIVGNLGMPSRQKHIYCSSQVHIDHGVGEFCTEQKVPHKH
jgi:hypothetical protein